MQTLTLQQLTNEFVNMNAPASSGCSDCEEKRKLVANSPTRFIFFVNRLIELEKDFRVYAEGSYYDVFVKESRAVSCGCGGSVVTEINYPSKEAMRVAIRVMFSQGILNNLIIHEERDNLQEQ